MPTTKTPERLLAALREGDRFLLTSHLSPDGDAVGSALGLARILRRLGKRAVVWSHDPPPRVYTRMPGADLIHTGEDPPAGFPEAFDSAIVLECPTPDRTGIGEALSRLPLINIDHHLGNTQYGTVNWIDTAAPSLGEMIHRVARALRVDLDRDTATCLYLTIVTDTGGFRFSNATAQAFESAAALVDDGAQPEVVSRWVNESHPESAVRLIGGMLDTLAVDHDGRIATAFVTDEMIERVGALPGDTEGLVDYPRSIDGVEVVALLRQTGDQEYKVSLRSRGEVDVEQLARRHGGGGHRNAAGFKTSGDQEAARRYVVAELLGILE